MIQKKAFKSKFLYCQGHPTTIFGKINICSEVVLRSRIFETFVVKEIRTDEKFLGDKNMPLSIIRSTMLCLQ